jgi:hypothetical protein
MKEKIKRKPIYSFQVQKKNDLSNKENDKDQ